MKSKAFTDFINCYFCICLMQAKYITSYTHKKQFRDLDYPEIALIGKSNCGKSTLINALLNHKNLARTSKTPGRTQMINIFLWQNCVYIADLPGYGYHKSSKNNSSTWDKLLDEYCHSKNLSMILWLVDCRRVLTEHELIYMHYLCNDLYKKLYLVLTKTDKLNKNSLIKKHHEFDKSLKANSMEKVNIIKVSSLKKTGIEKLRTLLVNKPSDNI